MSRNKRKRTKRLYAVGRNSRYPLGKSNHLMVTIECVRAEDVGTLPTTMMEVIYLKAHNKEEAKSIFLLSVRLAQSLDLDIGWDGTTRQRRTG